MPRDCVADGVCKGGRVTGCIEYGTIRAVHWKAFHRVDLAEKALPGFRQDMEILR